MAPRLDSRALQDLRGESDYPPASAPGGDVLIGKLIADRYRVVKKLGVGAQRGQGQGGRHRSDR